MSKLFSAVAIAALFAGATAFAQNQDAPAPSAAPPAGSAASDTTAPANQGGSDTMGKPAHHHHHHAHYMSASSGSASTDEDADKLNACMPDARPTAAQMQCMKQAEGSS